MVNPATWFSQEDLYGKCRWVKAHSDLISSLLFYRAKSNERGSDSEETRLKKSLALKNKPRTDEAKQNMRGPRGPMSEEGKRIRSITGIGKHFGSKSADHKIKISIALKGRKRGEQVKVICPHCSKEGGIGLMKRYHFQNCKIKEKQCNTEQ